MENSDSFSSKYGDLGPFSPPKKNKLKGKTSSQKETLVSRPIRNKSGWWTRVFFVANIRHLATKKKGWRIQQRDFSEF
jgi:hypothetical protein